MVLCLSHDGACTDSFENFREISLKRDLSNDITLNPSLFSLVNTFKYLPYCLPPHFTTENEGPKTRETAEKGEERSKEDGYTLHREGWEPSKQIVT